MEILQFLLSFFIKEYGHEALKPILDKLSENSFDIFKTLKSLSPETLAPLIKQFMSSSNKKTSNENFSMEVNNFNEISGFTDKELLTCLNNYFSKN